MVSFVYYIGGPLDSTNESRFVSPSSKGVIRNAVSERHECVDPTWPGSWLTEHYYRYISRASLRGVEMIVARHEWARNKGKDDSQPEVGGRVMR